MEEERNARKRGLEELYASVQKQGEVIPSDVTEYFLRRSGFQCEGKWADCVAVVKHVVVAVLLLFAVQKANHKELRFCFCLVCQSRAGHSACVREAVLPASAPSCRAAVLLSVGLFFGFFLFCFVLKAQFARLCMHKKFA